MDVIQHLDAIGVAGLSLYLYFRSNAKLNKISKAIYFAIKGLMAAKNQGANGDVDKALAEIEKFYKD